MKKLISVFIFLALLSVKYADGSITKSLTLQTQDLFTSKQIKVELNKAPLATVLAFVSNQCPCSQSHEAELKELAAIYTPKGFQFFGIHSNADEPAEKAREYFQASSLGFPIIQDSHSELADEWGAYKTPHVFIISRSGETLYMGGISDSQFFGGARKKYLRNALEELASHREVSIKQTTSIGCVIRRPK